MNGLLSLRVLIPAILCLFSAAGMALFSLTRLEQARCQALDEGGKDARVLVRHLQERMAEGGGEVDLLRARAGIAAEALDPDVETILLADERHEVVAAHRSEWTGRPAAEVSRYDPLAAAGVRLDQQPRIGPDGDRRRLAVHAPVSFGALPGEIRPSRFGTLFVEYDLARPLAEARAGALGDALRFCVAMLLLAAGLGLVLHQVVTRRMARMLAAIRAVQDGDLAARARLGGADELALLAQAFDAMAATLARRVEELRLSQRLLRENQDRCAVLVEGAHDLVTCVDAAGNFIFVNSMGDEVFGLAPALCLGLSAFDFVHAEDRARTQAWFRDRVAERATVASIENRLVAKDGRVRDVLWNCVFHYGPDGGLLSVDSIGRDITDRKQAELYAGLALETLRALNEGGDLETSAAGTLRAIREALGCDAAGIRVESHGDFPYFAQYGFPGEFLAVENTLVVRDCEGNACLGADGNPRLACTCGLVLSGRTDPANPLFTPGGSFWCNDARKLLDLAPGEDQRLRPRNRCVHEGFASIALVPIRMGTRIVGLLQLNDRRPSRFTLAGIQALEQVALHVGLAIQRLQLRTRLERNLAFMTATGRVAKVGGWELDLATQALDWTVETRKIHEVDEDFRPDVAAAIGFYDPESRPVIQAAVAAAIERGEPFDLELKIVTAKGRLRSVHALGRADRADGRTARIWGTFQDVTERRELEARLRQSEKMTAVGQLAGGIAHDFNNQLAGILGYAELLASRLDDPGLRNYAETIMTAARRSADLTRQLLAFARKGKYRSVSVDLHQVVVEVVALLQRSVDRRIAIRQQLEACPATTKGDPTQLQSALLNLGLNARDAMPEGGELLFASQVVEVRERTAALDLPAGRYVRLDVTDTGTGMDAATRQRLFEPFFTTKEVGKGTGLGLAAVYGTVQNHGGAIGVRSEPGRGSTFTLHLPLLEERAAADAAEPAVPAVPPSRILVVDDEAGVRDLLADLLRDLGHRVVVCEDGEQAVARYRESWRETDLVILDMVMPRLGGREVFLAMRAVNPAVRALLSSGHSLDGEAQAILDEGCRGFLQKPFRRDDLARRLAEALGRADAPPPPPA